MDSRPETVPNFLGVTGDAAYAIPSLVFGLLLFDIADAGRSGGGMLLSALKKLDLRLPFPGAGDDGNCDRLSMVRSESDGRDFFVETFLGSASSSRTCSGSGSFSRKPALELALEEALEADLNPSRLPNVSSSLLVFDVDVGGGGPFVWRDGGRANGLLKTGASFVEVEIRGWPMLGIPLVRRVEEVRDARPELGFTGAVVEGVLERTSDALDVFFCNVDVWGPGRDIDDMEGFLRNCSVEAGARN